MRVILFTGLMLVTLSAQAAYRVGKIVTPTSEQIISAVPVPDRPAKELRSFPFFLDEDAPPSKQKYVESIVSDFDFALLGVSVATFTPPAWPGSEARTLVHQGPGVNRITLTIVGDGYTQKEKEKFFADAQRITTDLFGTDTFHSYLALFNVQAVFVPSQDSGLSDIEQKNTALGLYRTPAGSKRAIYVGNVSAAEKALALAPEPTDYPILLANDDFYGGLGGRYAITTRSVKSGQVVLRHELGHNFGQVGEEYDGGQVYVGANFSETPDIGWAHWVDGGPLHVNESKFVMGDYIWQNLKGNPYSFTFDFPYDDYTFGLQVSTVGWSAPDQVSTQIDSKEIPLKGTFDIDRDFLEPVDPVRLSKGSHTILIQERVNDGDNVLGFARGWAYPADYDFAPDKIEAFSTFDDSGTKVGYRPTHDSCLMRNMEISKFCSVDQENMWLRFLDRVNLIDSLVSAKTDGHPSAVLKTLALPGLSIQWFKKTADGYVEIPEAKNASTLKPNEAGDFRVTVSFSTPEIRVQSPVLSDSAEISIR